MARPIIATPPNQPLVGNVIPSGLQRAFPPVLACWQHETGRWVCVHQIGRTAYVGWRIKPYWMGWLHEVVTFDESNDSDENFKSAMDCGRGLLALGPSDDVQEAYKTAKQKNRDASRERYRRKLENKPPTMRTMMSLAREAHAKIIGGKIGAQLFNGSVATENAVEPPAPKKGRPRVSPKFEQDKVNRYSELIAQQGMLHGIDGDVCEAFSKGKGGLSQFSEWLKTDAGKTAHAAVLAQVEEEFRPKPAEGA